MKQLLEAIQANISANVASVNYVDENWGQLDLYGPEIPVKWPCVLIDINGGQFSNIGRDNNRAPANRQEGTIAIELTIANLKLTNTSFKAPKIQKWHGFEIWEIVQNVHQFVHGWNPLKGSGKMMRTNISKVRRDDGVQEIRVVYSIGLHDC